MGENPSGVNMSQRYQAAMVLSGVGDALGYFNGRWEFCHSGKVIHKELKELGGLEKIKVSAPRWKVSDDTVMHLATADALAKWGRESPSNDKKCLFKLLAGQYILCMHDMAGRAPGLTCMGSTHLLRKSYLIPFNPRGGGCGAAMRAMCIGLRYPRPEDIGDLIAVGIESGRMTHHHPTGFLGSFAAALFVSYSIQGKPLNQWGADMLKLLPQCLQYLQMSGHCVEENTRGMKQAYFEDAWKNYLELRGITDGISEPTFPDKYDVEERDKFVKSVSYDGWGGASGHDAPMIAYDALLGCGNNWAELCSRSMFHMGDSDSTGVIAACCYGAMNGFAGVPENLYRNLEYRDRLLKAGKVLYLLSHSNEDISLADNDQSESPGSPPDLSDLDQLQSLVNESQATDIADSSQEACVQSQATDIADSSQEACVQSPSSQGQDSITSDLEELQPLDSKSQLTDAAGSSQESHVSDPTSLTPDSHSCDVEELQSLDSQSHLTNAAGSGEVASVPDTTRLQDSSNSESPAADAAYSIPDYVPSPTSQGQDSSSSNQPLVSDSEVAAIADHSQEACVQSPYSEGPEPNRPDLEELQSLDGDSQSGVAAGSSQEGCVQSRSSQGPESNSSDLEELPPMDSESPSGAAASSSQ